MQFVNHTPFPALAFEGIGTRGDSFHVLVMRQTLTWADNGHLLYADEQAPLCEVDEHFNGDLRASVREESDLCHYKPRCDVIVNGHAHAPLDSRGRPRARFNVRLLVKRPDTTAAPPPQPQGLNPDMRPHPHFMDAWRKEVERAEQTIVLGTRLIDKTLRIVGPRQLVRVGALARGLDRTVALATLGMLTNGDWKLTDPTPTATVALRLEHAFGGQCRLDASDAAATRVAARHRLTPEQVAQHPDADSFPVAHDAYPSNPWGRGFATDWYLSATGLQGVSAPQIESPARAFTEQDFDDARAGRVPLDERLVVGLGVRPKGHPDRARLAGTIDQRFIDGDAALPHDFDFAVWNAAWPDQQTEHLRGDEFVAMMNLCAADVPGARRDARGNVLLRLMLPGHLPFALVRHEAGELAPLPLRLDTLHVEPDQLTVTAVWRLTVPADNPIEGIEARQMPLARWQTALAIRDHTENVLFAMRSQEALWW